MLGDLLGHPGEACGQKTNFILSITLRITRKIQITLPIAEGCYSGRDSA